MKENILGNDKISVIVPIYNIEPYVGECIESIICQTYQNLQIILVDDGSTDKSGDICDAYAEKDARIKVLHKSNGGLVSARKAGLKIAEGEYVGFVDGDDFVDSKFYEVLLCDILKYQVDFVHMGYVREQGDVSQVCFGFDNRKWLLNKTTVTEFISDGIFSHKTMDAYHGIWNNLFKKEIIQKCYSKVPNDQFFGEDLLCFCWCLLESSSLYMHKVALYHYRNRTDSIMNIFSADRIVYYIKLQICLKDIFIEYGVYDALRQCLDEWLVRVISDLAEYLTKAKCLSFYYCKSIDLIAGKKVVIYGAGVVGQDYYMQLSINLVCQIVGWVDVNCHKYHFDYADVMDVEQLQNLQYDIVLIAVKSQELAKEIKQKLITEWGISQEMIVWEQPGAISREI